MKCVLLVHTSRFREPRTRADAVPLGVLHLASALAARGFRVRIADLNIEPWSTHFLVDVGLVGISCTSYSVGSALRVSKAIRTHDPSIPIIWGGVHPSLDPKGTSEHALVDGVIVGEGESAFADLAEDVFNGNHSSFSVQNPPYSRETDLDALPELAYQLLNLNRYNPRLIDIHTARGCPFTCRFCYNESTTYRSKSSQRIYCDIAKAQENFPQARLLVFCEDMFFAKFSRVREICEMLLTRSVGLPWTANCRIEHILAFGADMWELLRRSQCHLLKVGVESGSPRMQALMGKGNINTEMVLAAVELCRANSISVKLNFIIGLPTETHDDLVQSLRLIRNCERKNPALSRVAIGVYDPYPGTSLWSTALRAGYDAPGTLEEWGDWKGELRRLAWLDSRQSNWVRNLLFLCLSLDRPYEYSLDGLWCRQPRPRDPIKRFCWWLYRHLLRADFLMRSKLGTLRYMPERRLYEGLFSSIGLTSAPQPGID